MSDLLIATEYKAIAQALTLGTVAVDRLGEGDIATSFGGYKQSGSGGRDKSIFAHDQYTELTTIRIDTTDRSEDETAR